MAITTSRIPPPSPLRTCVFVVDDDDGQREALAALFGSVGLQVRGCRESSQLLAALEHPLEAACAVIDYRLSDINGLDLVRKAHQIDPGLPVVILTAFGDVPTAVESLRLGALDFMEKPCNDQELLERVQQGLAIDRARRLEQARIAALARQLASLTARERDVMTLVVAGLPNKRVAAQLGVTAKTVEAHRANVMAKMAARSLSQLINIALDLGVLPEYPDVLEHNNDSR